MSNKKSGTKKETETAPAVWVDELVAGDYQIPESVETAVSLPANNEEDEKGRSGESGDKWTRLDWFGLYGQSWGDEITAGSKKHPAKFPRGVIDKMYDYLIDCGYLEAGDLVIDPFGGIAGGALPAMVRGIDWIGVELEPVHAESGSRNIRNWIKTYGPIMETMGKTLGRAVLYHGDSREFCRIVWGESWKAWGHEGPINRRPRVLGSSPPFGHGETRDRSGNIQAGEIASMMNRSYTQDNQGEKDQNLALLGTDTADHAAVLDAIKRGEIVPQRPGALVSSSPFVNMIRGAGEGPGARFSPSTHKTAAVSQSNAAEYGETAGNLGNLTGDGAPVGPDVNPAEFPADSFWAAAAVIVDQGFQALEPGGVAVWHCKDFFSNGERVPFGQQWADLCEALGFVPLTWIRSWQIREAGNVRGLFDLSELDTAATVTDVLGNSTTKKGTALKRGQVRRIAGGEEKPARIVNKSMWKNIEENQKHARAYWETLDDERRAVYIADLLSYYDDKFPMYKACSAFPETDPAVMNEAERAEFNSMKNKGREAWAAYRAPLVAWERAGRPYSDQVDSIDNEDIIIMMKPKTAGSEQVKGG